jgi:hypothetical protein
MVERGAKISEIEATVRSGIQSPAKFGRTRFRRIFPYGGMWKGKYYARKQIDAFSARIRNGWLVLTIIVKYF